MIEQIKRFEVDSAGGSFTINMSQPYSLYYIYTDGDITLNANVSFVTAEPLTDISQRFIYGGRINLNGFTFNINGQYFTQAQLMMSWQAYSLFSLEESPAGWNTYIDIDDSDLTQQIPGTETLTIPNTGTVTLVSGVNNNYQRSSNTVTLNGNVNVALSTTGAIADDWFFIKHDGGVTIGAFTFQIEGINIPVYDALNGGFAVFAFFDGSVWRPTKVGGSVTADQIPDGSITAPKFAPIPGYSLFMNKTSSTDAVAAEASDASDKILTAAGWSYLTSENFAPSLLLPLVSNTNIGNALLLDINSNPIQLLEAPSSGNLNWVYGFIVTAQGGSPGTPFATDTNLEFYFDGNPTALVTVANVLGFTNDEITFVVPLSQASNASDTALMVRTPSSNPTAGTGTISIRTIYSVIQPPSLD